MYIALHVKYPLFLSDLNETNFLDSFSKNIEISHFMKIRQVGADLFHEDRLTGGRMDGRTDGRTGRHGEAYSCFSQFFERA